MRKKTILGEYNRYGYTIMISHLEGLKDLYHAGNHRLDSGQVASLGCMDCLSLKEIRSNCIKTGRDMALEMGYEWGGAERIGG